MVLQSGGYNVNRGFSSLQEEKETIKRALQTTPTERSIWHPIAMSWFIKWKMYVNFDDTLPEPRDPKEVENFHPGPIDNTPIKGTFGDELARGIVDGQDFVLLPKMYGDRLFKKYDGGPEYPREAINLGTYYSPLIQVNLFPTRLEIYHCDRHHPTPNRELKTHFMIRYYVKNTILENIIDDLKMKLSISYMNETRCWIRDPEHTSKNLKEEHSSSSKKQRVGRMLTADVVEWAGDWRYSPKLNKTLQDFLGNKDCIEIIIESSPRACRDNEWPRFAMLQGWKADLRVGDMVDAQDRSKRWYEALIKDIDATGKIHVHFKGWGSEFDEVIPPDQKSSRIKPLHTESEDRSNWEEGDSVELNISPPNIQPVWLPVTIVAQDLQADRIQVQYSSKTKRENLAKFIPSKTGAVDDDSIKKQQSSMINDDDVAHNSEDLVKEWHDLYGDTICALYTHTDKPKQNQYSSTYDSLTRSPNYSSSYSSRGYYSRYDYEKNTKATPPVNGAVGLQNLGNTCFMNSILQCLSNTDILSNLFREGNYKDQINYDNPLGHNGKVALSYGKLMKEMWSNAYTIVVPRDFKSTIGEFRPQFAGTEQQDSQEFMNFLLDGLHEDLNRIKKKPHVQKIESKGRDDILISSESWRRFLLRNDSELVDHYFGQLKSHVTCVNCGNESVTFDEYLSLSLPIPIRNTKNFTIFVQLLPIGTPPMKVTIEVEITDTMTQLKKILIDRLIELGVLLETSNSVSNSPVPAPPTEAKNSDDGFEMVQATDEDFEVVNNEGKSVQPMDVDDAPTTSPPPVPSNSSKYDKYYFHFATLFGTRPTSVFKNYNANDSGATAIQAFIGKMDTLMAFQLEHDVPDIKSSYSSSYYSSYSSRTITEKPVEPKAFAIDIASGVKGTYNRIDLIGYPARFSALKENPLTNHDMHLLVRRYIRRFLVPDPREISNWPYDLFVMNSYATQVKREVEDNNDKFESLVEGSDLVVICWHANALQEKIIDIDQVKSLRDLEPAKSHAKNDVVKPKSTSMYDIDDDEDNSNNLDEKKISIYDCLDKFIEREQLNETETIYCSKCKQHLAPIKKMDVYSAPDILIIHLKRFQFIPGQYFVHREKINDIIDFPINGLDLSKYVLGPKFDNAPPIYDLYGVSHHMGGLGGGHYVATCKNFLNNKWYKFNDSVVSETSENSIVSGTAYVLFYKRRTGGLRWGGIIPNPNPLPDEDD